MNWRESQASFRRRLATSYDPAGVDQYETWIAQLDTDDDHACLGRPATGVSVQGSRCASSMRGRGPGRCVGSSLSAADVELTALEPCAAMIARMKAKPELQTARVVEGYCDAESDRAHFDASRF